tara:strand:- start:1637 stop:1870 length:234 start_codon:yes stop_codon:yes gene_type:complete
MDLSRLKQRKETNMEHEKNVKMNGKSGLTSLVETFWTIGTSIAAAGVLQPYSQAHCQIAQEPHNQNLPKSLSCQRMR